MNKKVKTKLKKMLSLFVLNCFLLSYVYGPALANITDGKAMVEKYKNIFNEFMLPYSYGQIIKSHYAGTDRVVINIQDLHCHPKVQKNISNIIELFDKRYGIANIYLEGAYGDVDTQWLLQAVKGDRETADKILQTGRLTGAEYYSAVSGKTTIIKGLEQKDAYFDNLKRFAFIVENQDKINLILEGIKESTKKLKENYYSKRQYRLERLSDSYRKGKISPEKYYILLNKHIDRLGIDIYKYKHTFRYMTLIGLQKELDYKAIGTDLQNFMLLLKEHLSPDLYKMLSDSTDEFSGGVIGVNIMCAGNYYEEYVRCSIKSGADIIFSGAGLPSDLPKLVEGSRVKIAPIVSPPKAIRTLLRLWDKRYSRTADMIVVEGALAGGHLGFSKEDVERCKKEGYDKEIIEIIEIANEFGDKYNVEIPVIFGGGVFERADIEHYLSLGCAGVQMGTRFVATVECDASEAFKQAYVNAAAEDVIITKTPVGMPGRAIKNQLLREIEIEKQKIKACYQCLQSCDRANIPYCITTALISAVRGELDKALIFCGENVSRIKEIITVEKLFAELCAE